MQEVKLTQASNVRTVNVTEQTTNIELDEEAVIELIRAEVYEQNPHLLDFKGHVSIDIALDTSHGIFRGASVKIIQTV